MATLAVQRWRLELFYKSTDELAAQLPFLRAQTIKRFNLPNKRNDDDLIGAVQALTSGMDGLDICVHYSVKYNYDRSPAAAAARLEAFYTKLQSCCPPSNKLSLLIVSGGGQKKRFDSISAVQQIAKRYKDPAVPLHVAFNPYLPEGFDQEKERLQKKLATKKVAGIYLQIGTDLQRLREGLRHATALIDSMYTAEGLQRPSIHGSVFLPSARLLAQMRFRPWNGVYLSEEYLSSVEAADRVTRQLMQVYAEFGVVPLVETSVRNGKELSYALDLVQAGQ
jgi:hypothetical protein